MGGTGPWDAVTTAHVDGKGEALRATRDLRKGERLLRVAPLAAVPYAAELTRLCGGCFQPVGEVCASCRSARLCARCGAGAAGTLHAYECHALTRLRDGEEGLSLAHSDLRLLLRAPVVFGRRGSPWAPPRISAVYWNERYVPERTAAL